MNTFHSAKHQANGTGQKEERDEDGRPLLFFGKTGDHEVDQAEEEKQEDGEE